MESLSELFQVSQFGFSLSIEQRSAMELSLETLRKNYRFKKVVFWGRIKAHQRDYYIAQGYEGDLLTSKKSFVSQSLTKWAQLPEVNEQQKARAKTLHAMFTGDLSYEYVFKEEVQPWEPEKTKKVNSDGEEEVSEDEFEEEPEIDPETQLNEDPLGGKYLPVVKRRKRVRKYPLTEEVRLAAVVARIDADTSVVPRGAFLVDQADNVYQNARFEGLSTTEAGNLSFYLHLRKPVVLPKKPLHERYHANLLMDFLDRLADDVPKGAWALQFSETGKKATLRSLVWPGYFAYHVPGTNKFGGVYVGTGQANPDFGFMI